ncbi:MULTISPECIES: rubrerythrin [Anaerotruncus]|uniref:rubrerythrin n=1 Tax=Anaerotruncus TaxID=244127 RepID=UPI00082A5A13|nr:MULTISPECIES: rubrerythrin family protein [Anaerotruncus]RGX56891.1 rubrerythrin family protein [Anaerotruncus sp. AF02-27]
MKVLKGSKTEANLLAAFAGESQARNKYTFYAAKAKQDGFEQIGRIFEETANNEKEHAEIWFKLVHESMPATDVNLQDAANGERYEWEEMYKTFAEEAKAEGFDKIAALFSLVGQVEKEHMERYETLLQNVKNQMVFKKPQQVTWICLNCGHIFEGPEAPKMCPVCEKPQAWFQVRAQNY